MIRTHTPHTLMKPITGWSLSATMLMLVCGTTLGQTPVNQGGRILERDLRVGAGSEGLTPRANMMDEVRLRNALITGNVGGLRSFRGNVGYTAPGDFRSSLGSDTSYSFRRDASSPSVFSRPVSGTDALAYQYRGATGLATRQFGEVGRLGATGISAAQAAPGMASDLPESTGQSGLGARSGVLRSTGAFTATQELSPSVIGQERLPGGSAPVIASSLLGVRSPLRSPIQTRPLVPWKTPAQEDDKPRPGRVESLQKRIGEVEEDRARPGLAEPLVKPITKTVYEELIERLEAEAKAEQSRRQSDTPAAPRPDLLNTPAEVKPTDQTPDGATPPQTTPTDPKPDAADKLAQDRLAALRERLVPDAVRGLRSGSLRTLDPKSQEQSRETLREAMLAQRRNEPLDELTLELIRRSGGTSRTFVASPDGLVVDAYTDHMTKGQNFLGEGRYFDAEERFASALSAKPGDVTAMTARVHAQLGAGLYMSAAMNLKALFQQSPEVVAMRYTGPTIPQTKRMASIAGDLRANITRANDTGGTPSVEEAILLAYVGWQLAQRDTVTEGIAQANRSASILGRHEPLTELLERVWLQAPQFPQPTDLSTPAPKSDAPEGK